jgi:magnesium transporter
MDEDEAVCALEDLEVLQAAEVLVELPAATARALAARLSDDLVAAYLDVLPMDDALDLADELQPQRLEALLQVIPDEDAEEIRRLRAYPRGSVGRVMTERFFEVAPETTVAELLADLRLASEDKYETVNDVYVLEADRRLVGLFSLRRALRAEPSTPASALMRTEFEAAQAYDQAEDAAREMARYGFYALPVLSEDGRMLGLFTGDDAQAILREAESKDVLALGAVTGSGDAYLSLSPLQLIRRRLPWLLVLFVAETLTGAVLRHYTAASGARLESVGLAALMPFVPLIIGAGGNAGSQVTTTITRALALREVDTSEWLVVLAREFLAALVIGALLGAIGYLRARLWGGPAAVPMIVGLALPIVVLWAGSFGALLPMGARRLGLDPAVMSAPLVTTFVDATGLIIYFEVARQVVPGLFG